MKKGMKCAGLLVAAAALTMIPAAAGEIETGSAPGAWRWGSEVDVLPYATKGYYGSLVASRGVWRLRGVAARVTAPDFMVSEGFTDKRTDAYAFLADRFVGSRRMRQEGWWVGGGVEAWKNRIRREEGGEYTSYNNLMLTAGAGYVWKISRHIYLNPWAGAHFAVAGEMDPVVSGRPYHQKRFIPEASIKIGFTF